MRGLNDADSIQEKNRKSTLCQKVENRKKKSKIDTQSKNRKAKIENRIFLESASQSASFPRGMDSPISEKIHIIQILITFEEKSLGSR